MIISLISLEAKVLERVVYIAPSAPINQLILVLYHHHLSLKRHTKLKPLVSETEINNTEKIIINKKGKNAAAATSAMRATVALTSLSPLIAQRGQ